MNKSTSNNPKKGKKERVRQADRQKEKKSQREKEYWERASVRWGKLGESEQGVVEIIKQSRKKTN